MANNTVDFSSILGKGLGPRHMEYTWRDIALYALGVGAGKNDLPYIYERCKSGMKILPTFTLLPYINNINMYPLRYVPSGPNEILSDFIVAQLGYTPNRLHMAMELTVHRPIRDLEGMLITEDRLNAVYDRGTGKGIVADCQMDVYDRAGNALSTLHSYHFHNAFGGFGGQSFSPCKISYPDRAPDYSVAEHMPDNISVLYRLSGDTYNVHIDPEVSGAYGYKAPFNQGLCTYGYAVRMIIQQLFPYEPERVKRIYAQMRNVCYPGQNVVLQIWSIDEGRVVFKLLGEENVLLLGNGILEFQC